MMHVKTLLLTANPTVILMKRVEFVFNTHTKTYGDRVQVLFIVQIEIVDCNHIRLMLSLICLTAKFLIIETVKSNAEN